MDKTADLLFQYIGNLLYSPEKARLDVNELAEDFRELGKGLLFFAEMLIEQREFALALSKGNLSVEPPSPQNGLAAPLKGLHSSLKHLAWQSQQVAKGDYHQKVDFMGEFADAFNTMTRQLDEQREALLNEIENSKRKTLALEQNITLFEAITEHAPQWIIVLARETGRSLFTNTTGREALEASNALSTRLWNWLEGYIDRLPEEETARCTDDTEIETDEKTWHLSVTIYPLIWRKHKAIAFVITDMSEEREHMQELESVAYQDTLTHVNSRHYGMKVLRDWMNRRCPFCMCFVDIDNLKYVNDSFGHPAGDEYIISVAKLLSSFSRKVQVSRLGGDEFMLLQPDWTGQQAEARLAKLRAELAMQNTGADHPYTRSISYGVVEVLKDNTFSASHLLSMADDKMYRFKRAHKKHP